MNLTGRSAAAFLLAWLAAAGGRAVELGTHADPSGREGAFALVSPPLRPGEAPGALVFFHADDGARDFAEWLSPRLQEVAARHGLVLVSVQEPDRGCWWAPRTEDDARWTLDFLEHVLVARHGVDRRRIFLAGKSGGAFFAAGLPVHAGHSFSGAVIALCGGDVPRLNGGDCEAETDAPAVPEPLPRPAPDTLRYWFASTREDEWLDYSLDAAILYARLGAGVTVVFPEGDGHCEFPLEEEIERALEAVDR